MVERRQLKEVRRIRRKALLLGVLLVAVPLAASGCLGGIFPGLTDDIAVGTTVRNFVDAWGRLSAEDMEKCLTSQVSFGGGDPESSDVLVEDLLATFEVGAFDVQWVEAGVDGAVAVHRVSDTEYTAAADVRLKYRYTPQDQNRLDVSDPYYDVEDIYPTVFVLEKVGSDWKINSITIDSGKRQVAIQQSWMTFEEGMRDEDVDMVLSVINDPFEWVEPGAPPVTTRDEWRAVLEQLFSPGDVIVDFGLAAATALSLDDQQGVVHGWLFSQWQGQPQPSSGEVLIDVIYADGMWKVRKIEAL